VAIHSAIIDLNPSISLATVYKTLDSLKKVDLIKEINIGDDKSRYDANSDSHAHIVCTACYTILDMHDIDSLQMVREEVIKKSDYDINFDQIIFYGVCPECVDNNADEA